MGLSCAGRERGKYIHSSCPAPRFCHKPGGESCMYKFLPDGIVQQELQRTATIFLWKKPNIFPPLTNPSPAPCTFCVVHRQSNNVITLLWKQSDKCPSSPRPKAKRSTYVGCFFREDEYTYRGPRPRTTERALPKEGSPVKKNDVDVELFFQDSRVPPFGRRGFHRGRGGYAHSRELPPDCLSLPE